MLAIGVYSITLRYGFVQDDGAAIVLNADVTGSAPVMGLFHHNFWGEELKGPRGATNHHSYRPVPIILWRILHASVGLQPSVFHACNLVVHALNTVGLWYLFSHIITLLIGVKHSTTIATGASLIFAVHPINTEAVSSVVGLADLLACFFSLSCVHACLVGMASPHHSRIPMIAIVSAFLGLFSKEVSIMAFPLTLCVDWLLTNFSATRFFHQQLGNLKGRPKPASDPEQLQIAKDRAFLSRAGMMTLATLLLLALRLIVNRDQEYDVPWQFNPAQKLLHPVSRVLTFLQYTTVHMSKLVFPVNLSSDYSGLT